MSMYICRYVDIDAYIYVYTYVYAAYLRLLVPKAIPGIAVGTRVCQSP